MTTFIAVVLLGMCFACARGFVVGGDRITVRLVPVLLVTEVRTTVWRVRDARQIISIGSCPATCSNEMFDFLGENQNEIRTEYERLVSAYHF